MALPPPRTPDWSQPVTPALTDEELKELSRWIQGPVMRSTPLVKAIEKILRDRSLTVEITQPVDAPSTCKVSKDGFVLFNGRDYSADAEDRFRVSRALSLAEEWEAMHKAVPGLQLGANHVASELRNRLQERP